MAFKPNYNQQRAERNRAKQLKKEEKQREQEELKAKRRAAREADPDAVLPDEDAPPQPE